MYLYYCKYYETKLLRNKAEAGLIKAYEQVEKIYQTAIQAVGFFPDADIIWRAYKSYLDNKIRSSSSIDMWRTYFHRVVEFPIRSVDDFWNEFSRFEASELTNRNLSDEETKKLLGEVLSQYFDQYKLASKV